MACSISSALAFCGWRLRFSPILRHTSASRMSGIWPSIERLASWRLSGGFIDDDPGGALVAAGRGIGFEAVDRLRSGRHGMDVLGCGAALRGVDGRRIAISQPYGGSLMGLDSALCDQALGAGMVAHDHALIGQLANCHDVAIVAEDALAAGHCRIVNAIEEAHAVSDRERQCVGPPIRSVASRSVASGPSRPARRDWHE